MDNDRHDDAGTPDAIIWFKGIPKVTVSANGISFNLAAQEELGNPPYIAFGYNAGKNWLLVKPLDEPTDESFTFAERKRERYLKIHRRELIQFLARLRGQDQWETVQAPAFWSDEYSCLVADLGLNEPEEADFDSPE